MTPHRPGATGRRRLGATDYTRRILVETDRRALAAGVSIGLFGVLLGYSTVSPAPMRRVVEASDALWWVFSPMLTAIITLVALVVSFNQLILSQELGALGDQHTRMREAMAFREDIEADLDVDVAPADPAAFMSAILTAIHANAVGIGDAPDGPESVEGGSVRSAVAEMAEEARSVSEALEGARFGSFEVLSAALDFGYARRIVEVRRLLASRRDDLSAETVSELREALRLLEYFGPAREHFKTLYFQWELIDLSRLMLYTSVPALVVSLAMLLYVDPAGLTGSSLGIDHLVWVTCAAVTVVLVPFVLLVSYVLRIATVAKRTLAMGPFVLQQTGEPNDPAPRRRPTTRLDRGP